MKKEDKRIHNNDFEQVEECYICKKLFWAKSKLELGNWETHCKKCDNKKIEELLQKEGFIRKNGIPHYGSNNQVFAWTSEKGTLFNSNYSPQSEEEKTIWYNGIVNIVKFEEQFSNKK